MARDTAAAVRGALAPRLGWHDLIGKPCAAAATTSVVLKQVGWRGEPTPCGPDCTVLEDRRMLLEEVARDRWWSPSTPAAEDRRAG